MASLGETYEKLMKFMRFFVNWAPGVFIPIYKIRDGKKTLRDQDISRPRNWSRSVQCPDSSAVSTCLKLS